MTDLLHRKQNRKGSDSESSISEANCETLMNSPDEGSFTVNKPGCSGNHASKASSKSVESVGQQAIKLQIPAQLESLGKCLDRMEEQAVKKAQVQQCLRELAK